MSITGIVENDTIKLPVHVPDGTRARIVLEPAGEGAMSSAGGKTAYDLMKAGFGCASSGVGDLNTNKKHLEGLGEWRQ